MDKNYLSKIIAKDAQGLQMISAYCSGAKINIQTIKYLPNNKIFLAYLDRESLETDQKNIRINSYLRFEFVDSVKSKNINQNKTDLNLELLAIEYLKNNKNYEIDLIFTNNGYITLSTEVIEATLEDQKSNL